MPYGAHLPFDIITLAGEKLARVQIKSTHVGESGRDCYHINTKQGGNHNVRPYAQGQFDYLAATVMPLKTWYIIPAEKVTDVISIRLYADIPERGGHNGTRRFEKFRDAWNLLF